MNYDMIQKLSRQAKIGLKRSFGKNASDIRMQDAISFYAIAPNKMSQKEEQNLFFAITMYCNYEDVLDRSLPFNDAVAKYYKICSDSGKKSLESFVDSSYVLKGTFFPRLYSLIKQMESKGIYVEPNSVYQALTYWDAKSKARKKDIAQKITMKKEEL